MKSRLRLFAIAATFFLASADQSFPTDKVFGKLASALASLTDRDNLQTRVTAFLLSTFVKAIESYQTEYGRLPEGDNGTLIALLAGADLNKANHRQITFLDLGGDSIKPRPHSAVFLNSAGELLDGWGKPLVIRRSGSGIAILSTGENGILDQSLDDADSSDDIYVLILRSASP